MSHSNVKIIDFHSHYIDPAWRPTPPATRGATSSVRPLLTDIHGQLNALAAAGIDGQVLSAPPASLAAPGERLAPACVQRVNEGLANLVVAHPEQLLALGTIDVFQGDVAAREVERVVRQLGFGGIVVDCAQDGTFLDAPEARPALEAAAALQAAIFIHPVSPVGLTERYAALGSTGVLLARGVENAASVLALLRSGVLEDLPSLRVVIPAIGAPALLFAALADREYGCNAGWRGALPSQARRRLMLDTMGLDPALLRFAVSVLGAEHVLFGTDRPIMPLATRSRAIEALSAARVTAAHDQAAILSGNALRILKRCANAANRHRPCDARGIASAELHAPPLYGEADWDWVVR